MIYKYSGIPVSFVASLPVICATNTGVGDTSWSTDINFTGMYGNTLYFQSTLGLSIHFSFTSFVKRQALNMGNGIFKSLFVWYLSLPCCKFLPSICVQTGKYGHGIVGWRIFAHGISHWEHPINVLSNETRTRSKTEKGLISLRTRKA